jgi:hypothetical protein
MVGVEVPLLTNNISCLFALAVALFLQTSCAGLHNVRVNEPPRLNPLASSEQIGVSKAVKFVSGCQKKGRSNLCPKIATEETLRMLGAMVGEDKKVLAVTFWSEKQKHTVVVLLERAWTGWKVREILLPTTDPCDPCRATGRPIAGVRFLFSTFFIYLRFYIAIIK